MDRIKQLYDSSNIPSPIFVICYHLYDCGLAPGLKANDGWVMVKSIAQEERGKADPCDDSPESPSSGTVRRDKG